MKKTLVILITFAMVLSLAACGKAEETPAQTELPIAYDDVAPASPAEMTPETGVPNPMVAVDSVSAINEQLGCRLVAPGVMGISDDGFFVIGGEMGQYDFSVNGIEYSFRFQDTDEDISGVYIGETTLLDGAEDGDVVTADGTTGARWFAEEGQYCLTTSGEIDAETFASIVEEMRTIQNMDSTDVMEVPADTTSDSAEDYSESWYANLAGEWQDSTSGRASMTVENCVDHAFITVRWGDSANTTYEWTMNVTMGPEEADGTNKLSYTDCSKRVVSSDGTTETVTVIYEDGEGYFTLNQGGFLLWDGAAEENCTGCVFEQFLSAASLQ